MLLGGNSSGDSGTKHSGSGHDPCSSGTSSPHADPNQSYQAQLLKPQHQNAYPQYPPGMLHCLKLIVLLVTQLILA